MHYLFQAGSTGTDHLGLYKDDSQGDPQLHFKVVDGAQTYEVTEGAEMAAGSWNSLVATWRDNGGQANLYLNGQGSDSDTVTGTLSDTLDIWLGSKAGGGDVVEAAVANLMVYSEEMTEAQALSMHRALIWTDILPEDEEWTTSTVTTTYEYDGLYRVITATYSAGAEYIYTYDPVGNRQTMDSPEGTVNYTYDAANRLTSVGGVTYTWDDNGNLTSDGVRDYDYDRANRLTQVTGSPLTTQFAYNGDGVRISKTVDAGTTQYVLDLAATLPVVISDTDAIYLYGLDTIAQQQAERQYYLHDGLGSVRQLADANGQIATNYAYDPFGVPLAGGSVPNPYRFTGEAWDAEVELLYLRARYYHPGMGRFVTRDPWMGDYSHPATLNPYVYVTNNPVSLVDPSGETRRPPYPIELRDAQADDMVELLHRQYGVHVIDPTEWSRSELGHIIEAVDDLATFMGGPAGFQSEIRSVGFSRLAWRTRYAAVTLPLLDVVYFETAPWGNPSLLKWDTVHELAHVWDMRKGLQLSSGLMQATGSTYRVTCVLPPERFQVIEAYEPGGEWLEGRTVPPNPLEDWADSVPTYVYESYAYLHQRMISPIRWGFVRQHMQIKLPYPPHWIPYFYDPDEFPPLPGDFPPYPDYPLRHV